jgi:mono/diheme cytochrome c family protein
LALKAAARYHRAIKHQSLFAVLLLAVFAPVARACSNSDSEPTTPPPNGAPGAEPGVAPFRTTGCVACHSNEARGTVAGPDRQGHTAEHVRFQVRTPVGTMPNYDTTAVSDAGLEDIAAFIVAIDAGDGHSPHTRVCYAGVPMSSERPLVRSWSGAEAHSLLIHALEDG